MEKIGQGVTEIWVPKVWQPPARPDRDDNTPPELELKMELKLVELKMELELKSLELELELKTGIDFFATATTVAAITS